MSADDEEEEDEDDRAGGAEEQEQDIFELEGQTEEEVQLDPTRFREEGQGEERREGDVALERVTGRGGFEGAATATAPEDEPSTSGRPQVDPCLVLSKQAAANKAAPSGNPLARVWQEPSLKRSKENCLVERHSLEASRRAVLQFP